MKAAFSILLVWCFCTSCHTSRKFYYPFDDKDKGIVRTVFSNGRIACDNGLCIKIEKEDSSGNSYSFAGSKPLWVTAKLKAASGDANASFTIKLNIKNAGLIRLKKMESLMLDEISDKLVDANPAAISEYLKTINTKK